MFVGPINHPLNWPIDGAFRHAHVMNDFLRKLRAVLAVNSHHLGDFGLQRVPLSHLPFDKILALRAIPCRATFKIGFILFADCAGAARHNVDQTHQAFTEPRMTRSHFVGLSGFLLSRESRHYWRWDLTIFSR
ncbi:MAG: hypothetical protein AB8B85_15120 [Paracoccaceae bacterium]